jgi:hypothetical protein
MSGLYTVFRQRQYMITIHDEPSTYLLFDPFLDIRHVREVRHHAQTCDTEVKDLETEERH